MKNNSFIPFYGIGRMYKDHSSEISTIINKIYSSGQVLMGPEVELFESDISIRCKRKYAVAVGSCTDALYFSLIAAGISNGDEVLITGFSYIASATPILRAGAVPVFVDINTDNFQMSLDDLARKITDKTKAIIGVHLFGEMLDPKFIIELAESNDLALIEDSAQSLGSKNKGYTSGSLGISSCLSFDPTKIIGAFGNGGAILCDDIETRDHVKKLRNHGKNEAGEFEILGYNSRMASAQAALLSFQLNKLDDWISRRNEIAEYYNTELSGLEDISVPVSEEGSVHTFHKYVILARERNELQKHLKDVSIQTQIHYGRPIYEHGVFRESMYRAENVKHIPLRTKQVLSLPIYPELKDEEVRRICEAINGFYQN